MSSAERDLEIERPGMEITRRRALNLFGLAAAVGGSTMLTGCGEGEPSAKEAQQPVQGEVDNGIRNIQSPRFGAVGDGVADDTGAIQAAIDSLPSDLVRGGTVFFPVGHYRVTSPLRLYGRSIRMVGAGGTSAIESDPGYGSVLFATGNATTLLEIGDNHDINQFGPVLENLSFVAEYGASGVTLVRNRSTIQSTFKNCYFRQADRGVHFTSTVRDGGKGDSGWAYFEQCFFYDLTYGILGENEDPDSALSNQFVLLGGGFTNCSYPLRIASGSGGARIFGPKINNCDVGLYVGGAACQIFGIHIENCKLGIKIESDGVRPNSGEANLVCGGIIVGYEDPAPDTTGIRVEATARDTTIMNTRYVNLGSGLVNRGLNTLHMPIGGPLSLNGGTGQNLLELAQDGALTAAIRVDNGLVFDLRGEAGGLAVNLPSSSEVASFDIRNSEGAGLFSVSGDGSLALEGGGLTLGKPATKPSAPGASRATLFTRDDDTGKAQLCVRFETGTEQVLAAEP